ncbi:hypothetical protein [Halorientalis salina]|uniref:hypothetical protein n=1 Tax=Halorientalis salina TaxID=2932266 RepID=UPI0010ABDC3A|nr:hypothetical protein [Halorientalis salina]
MTATLRDSLPGRSAARRVLSAVGVVVLFRFLFEFTWPQVVVITLVLLVSESVELSEPIPGMDERHFRLLLGLIGVAAGGVAYWGQSDAGVAVAGFVVGGWLVLDALYSLRTGLRAVDDDLEEAGFGELMLLMQVGNLVAEELKTGPKTVPELAEACDMTESRVRDALDYHEQAGTASREGDLWILDESKIGPWPFVRDNARRLLARLLRPFRLFVPS